MIKKTSTKRKKKEKCNKNVKNCYIWNRKTKKMQIAHKHKTSRRTNWKDLKKNVSYSVTMQLLQLKVISSKTKLMCYLKE